MNSNANANLHRTRELGELISDALNNLSQHLPDLVLMAAPAVFLSFVFTLLQLVAGSGTILAALLSIAALPVYFVSYQLAGAAVCVAVESTATGDMIGANEALNQASDRLSDLLWAALRAGAIILLLCITIVGIPFGIYRAVRWAFVSQSIMLDSQTQESALSYSAKLVQGRWWSTFGRLIVAGLAVAIPSVIITALLTVLLPGILRIILTSAVELVTLPYGVLVTTLLFYDLKLRRAADEGAATKIVQ